MSGWREVAECKGDAMRYAPMELLVTYQPAEKQMLLGLTPAGFHIVAIGSVSVDNGYVSVPMLIQRRLRVNDDDTGGAE